MALWLRRARGSDEQPSNSASPPPGAGDNPFVIAKMPSGWLVIGDIQPLRGYCVLLADPWSPASMPWSEAERARYCLDMIRAGDALLAVTGAARINYEILANLDPCAPHPPHPQIRRRAGRQAPRSADAGLRAGRRRRPFDEARDRPLMDARAALAGAEPDVTSVPAEWAPHAPCGWASPAMRSCGRTTSRPPRPRSRRWRAPWPARAASGCG